MSNFSFIEALCLIEAQRVASLPSPLFSIEDFYRTKDMSPDSLEAFQLAYDQAYCVEDADYRDALFQPFEQFVYKAPVLAEGVALSTEDFTQLVFNRLSTIDAYGSGVFCLKDEYLKSLPRNAKAAVILLSSYGDEDSSRHDEHMLLYTPCLFYYDDKSKRIIGGEVADIVLTENNKVEIKNHCQLAAPLPSWLSKALKAGEGVGGKRAFYFSPIEKTISVRCSEEVYLRAKEYQDPDRPVGNKSLSGTRLLLPCQAKAGSNPLESLKHHSWT